MNVFLILTIVALVISLVAIILAWQREKKEVSRLNAQAKAKDEVLSLIGHNLRGPLNSTVGLEDLIIEYIEDQEWDEIKTTFTELDSNLASLRDLVEKLIVYSLSQHPADDLKIEGLEVGQVVPDLIQRFSGLAHAKSLTIVPSIAPGKVKAEKFALSAALGAVLENAIRFSPAGSVISIQGKPDASGKYRLEILDSGPGFEDVKKAFTFDRKAIKEDADHIKSVGLGLITAQSWINEIGGTIFVSTNKKEGAGVTIEIPTFSILSNI